MLDGDDRNSAQAMAAHTALAFIEVRTSQECAHPASALCGTARKQDKRR